MIEWVKQFFKSDVILEKINNLSENLKEFKTEVNKKFDSIDTETKENKEILIRLDEKFKTYAQKQSPKKLTEDGHAILKEINASDYLKDNCNLLEDTELQKKTDIEIYMASIEWVKQNAEKKSYGNKIE